MQPDNSWVRVQGVRPRHNTHLPKGGGSGTLCGAERGPEPRGHSPLFRAGGGMDYCLLGGVAAEPLGTFPRSGSLSEPGDGRVPTGLPLAPAVEGSSSGCVFHKRGKATRDMTSSKAAGCSAPKRRLFSGPSVSPAPAQLRGSNTAPANPRGSASGSQPAPQSKPRPVEERPQRPSLLSFKWEEARRKFSHVHRAIWRGAPPLPLRGRETSRLLPPETEFLSELPVASQPRGDGRRGPCNLRCARKGFIIEVQTPEPQGWTLTL